MMHRVPVSADSAHRTYWSVAEARTARPGLPILIDARHAMDGPAREPLDARELQARGLLSPELERALQAEVTALLGEARATAEER